jgi:hypothetical protein
MFPLSFVRFPGVWILCPDAFETLCHLHRSYRRFWTACLESVPKRRTWNLAVGESPKRKPTIHLYFPHQSILKTALVLNCCHWLPHLCSGYHHRILCLRCGRLTYHECDCWCRDAVELAYCVEHIPSWEANRFSASQEIPHI